MGQSYIIPATPESEVTLQPRGFLLLDSGAQYLDGTTDITRTIALGELTEEEKAQAMKAYNEQFSNPYRAAELGFIDEIIMPRQTRYKLIQALEMAKIRARAIRQRNMAICLVNQGRRFENYK